MYGRPHQAATQNKVTIYIDIMKATWRVRITNNYNLAVAAHKSTFHVPEVEFLGYILNETGVTMSERKAEAVKKWEVPKSVKHIQRFLGFANFYYRFIKGFSGICRPITNLLRKESKFEWKTEATKAFTELKEAFTSAPIL